MSSYDATFLSRVQKRWNHLINSSGFPAASGKVVIDLTLMSDGHITDLKVRENEAGQIPALLCERAISDAAPHNPWPDDMRRTLGADRRKATITFFYGPVDGRVLSTARP